MCPELRFSKTELTHLAARYQYPAQVTEVLNIREIVKSRGYLTKADLKTVAQWKAPRSARHIEENSEEYVKEITTFALAAKNERSRAEVLTNLDGVRWPMASVILHFFHKENYPILDFRALWSLSLELPAQYSFGFWWTYVEFCRSLSKETGVDMRTLDKALWQYSKENQENA
jgi:hypothetical protein